MKELQEVKPILTNVLNVIDEFCRENNLRYSLAYGTLIGAVRHKGFIPWDDDIDIMMPRPDYEFFQKNFKHSLMKVVNGNNGKDYVYPFFKVYDSRTIVVEQSDLSTHFGLYVDVFPIDGMPSNKMIRKIYSSYFNALKELISIKNMSSSKTRSKFKAGMVKILKIIFSILPVNAFAKCMNKSVALYPFSKSEQVGNLMWESYGIKGFPKEMFGSYTDLKFENLSVKAVSNFDKWLKTIYGDYMKLPPEDKRKSNHSFTAYLREDKIL